MTIEKELPSISWLVDEPTYRADHALSYSTLSRYDKEGFSNLKSLFEKVSSPSLTFGSIIDTLVTGSQDEFAEHFYVTDVPSPGEKERDIADMLYDRFGSTYKSFYDLPYDAVLETAKSVNYWNNWKEDTRVKVLKERCPGYYNVKALAGNRTIVTTGLYYKATEVVRALKTSAATHGYFADNDPMSPVRRYYQLKFKATIKDVDYRCMADLLVVDYEDKKIIPIDLKTSGHKEWEFQDSFCQWNYMIQARLYWLIIKANLMNDPYFKDFKLENYRFVVINKDSLTPLVWEFPLTKASGTLVDGKGNTYRDPLELGTELRSYLDNRPPVPKGIDVDGVNTITCLHKLNA